MTNVGDLGRRATERVINDPTERRTAEALGIAPWAGGERDVYVALMAHEVSGRRTRNRP